MTDTFAIIVLDIRAALATLEAADLDALPPLVGARVLLDTEAVRARLVMLAAVADEHRHARLLAGKG